MTYEEYFEGLGCSPDEVEICAAAARARYQRDLDAATATIARGCVLIDDPAAEDLRWAEEAEEAG